MRVIHNVLSDGATLTTATGIASGALTNLQNNTLAQAITFSATTASIVVDFGVATAITAAAIAGHNLGGSTSDRWRVEGNSTNAWTAPAAQSPWRRAWLGRIGIIYTSGSYRYWRITLEGASNVSLSRLVLGTYIDSVKGLSRQFKWSLDRSHVRTLSPAGQVLYSSGASTTTTQVRIENYDSTAFVAALPVGAAIIDLLPGHPTRGVDSRAYGDIHGIQVTEISSNTNTVEMSITNMLPPPYIAETAHD